MNIPKNSIYFFLVVMLLIASPILFMLQVHSVGTIVRVTPPRITSSVGQSFILNMSITNVTNLSAWQLYILFNPEILNCTGVSIPANNIFAPYVIGMTMTTLNNTAGYIRAFCALEGTQGATGSGTLCQIEFRSKAPGITIINIADKMQAPRGSYLQDPYYNLIPFDTNDGVIEVSGPGFQRNVFDVVVNSTTYPVIIFSNSSITSFSYSDPLKTMSFDASGLTGTNGSTFIVFSKQLLDGVFAVLVDDTAITHALTSNQTHSILSFTYSHSTKHVTILLTITGDVNGDRTVDMLDISITIDAFLTSPGDSGWNPLADINGDNSVDMADIAIETENFLNRWEP